MGGGMNMTRFTFVKIYADEDRVFVAGCTDDEEITISNHPNTALGRTTAERNAANVAAGHGCAYGWNT